MKIKLFISFITRRKIFYDSKNLHKVKSKVVVFTIKNEKEVFDRVHR